MANEGVRDGLDDGPRMDGSDLPKPERKTMATKVKIIMEDGTERIGYLDMRTFRHSGNIGDAFSRLDLTKPLKLRRGGPGLQLKIWFADEQRIYGAYRYYDTQKWLLHQWCLDGSAMVRKRPHNNDLVYA